ncbi:hypothetical protein KSC_029670 [Ktedonobacter sp. SOSP1-52]|nr:hypothetical protein KSC_029670 [Ktedonobacter sp. SOSP1-52]
MLVGIGIILILLITRPWRLSKHAERFHRGMSRFVGSTFVLRGSERSLPGCSYQTLAPGQRAVA